ncbi:hypothetical protein [Methylovulum psychrotolerans]|uniref:hypothetical protein n=1 Tax=Methylovulum psychrotolerans TaxID=1704499 RepID=UPI0018DF459C|nr:hypothetical protein [Methylovulum psychrotolerans]
MEKEKIELYTDYLICNQGFATATGLSAMPSAKARGKTGGRPKTDPEKLENARILYENSDKTAAEVCEIAGVGRRKFFSHIAEKRSASRKN